MKKIFLLIVLVALMCGCQAIQQASKPFDPLDCLPTLLDAAKPTEHPEQKEWYRHDGRVLEVLQFIGTEKVEEKDLNFYLVVPHNFDKRWMTIAVISHNDYVGSELLRDGVYAYIGPYSYTTKNNSSKTVRMFIEVPEVNVEEAVEKVRAEAESEVQQDESK